MTYTGSEGTGSRGGNRNSRRKGRSHDDEAPPLEDGEALLLLCGGEGDPFCEDALPVCVRTSLEILGVLRPAWTF